MATFWRVKVFNKIQDKLFAAYMAVLESEIEKTISTEKKIAFKDIESMVENFEDSGNCFELFRFLQTIADISINEVTIHMLGSTKLMPDEPYLQLQNVIMADVK